MTIAVVVVVIIIIIINKPQLRGRMGDIEILWALLLEKEVPLW